MNILECINSLILEAEDPIKKNSAVQDKKKEESTEQFHERIKFNKWKREMIKKNVIRIGFPKQFFGPHEQTEKDIVKKQKEQQVQAQADMAKQQHDLNVLKATPNPISSKPVSPNLAGANKDNVETSPTKKTLDTNIVSKTQSLIKDMDPKEADKLFKMTKGMEKKFKNKKGYKCKSCNFPIIKYSGRYPKKCPGCNKELIRN